MNVLVIGTYRISRTLTNKKSFDEGESFKEGKRNYVLQSKFYNETNSLKNLSKCNNWHDFKLDKTN